MSEYEILGWTESDEPCWAASDMTHRRDKSGLVRYGIVKSILYISQECFNNIYQNTQIYYFTELQQVPVLQFYLNILWVDQCSSNLTPFVLVEVG